MSQFRNVFVMAALTCAGCRTGVTVVDITGETNRQTVVAAGPKDVYQGHPTTVLTKSGKLICVWCLGHGGPSGPAAESTDGGRTWTRINSAEAATVTILSSALGCTVEDLLERRFNPQTRHGLRHVYAAGTGVYPQMMRFVDAAVIAAFMAGQARS